MRPEEHWEVGPTAVGSKGQQPKDTHAYPDMQKDVVRMGKRWLIGQAGRHTMPCRNHIRRQVGHTYRVTAIVAEPVIHTIAKPGAIINHMQGTQPEEWAHQGSAMPSRPHMPINNIMPDLRVKNAEHESQYRDTGQTSTDQ